MKVLAERGLPPQVSTMVMLSLKPYWTFSCSQFHDGRSGEEKTYDLSDGVTSTLGDAPLRCLDEQFLAKREYSFHSHCIKGERCDQHCDFQDSVNQWKVERLFSCIVMNSSGSVRHTDLTVFARRYLFPAWRFSRSLDGTLTMFAFSGYFQIFRCPRVFRTPLPRSMLWASLRHPSSSAVPSSDASSIGTASADFCGNLRRFHDLKKLLGAFLVQGGMECAHGFVCVRHLRGFRLILTLLSDGYSRSSCLDSCNGAPHTVIFKFTLCQTSRVLAEHVMISCASMPQAMGDRFSRLKDISASLLLGRFETHDGRHSDGI